MKTKAVFLDRDGTIIEDLAYNDSVDRLFLLPGALAALQRLQAAGFLIVVITNQSGIGRGYFEEEIVQEQHRRLAALLAAKGVAVAAFEYCPHHPDTACDCRKPAPGMLLRVMERLQIDPARSWMIGDKPDDALAGRRAGCRGVVLGDPCDEADFAVPDLSAAAKLILNHDHM